MSDNLSYLETPEFSAHMRELAVHSVQAEFERIAAEESGTAPPWRLLLMIGSALTSETSERAQEAALRIAQTCVASETANGVQKEAAALLLERLGNVPALELARRRDLVPEDRWNSVPLDLAIDAMRRRVELEIALADGSVIEGNSFQRDFWTLAGQHQWVSVSAPTSAGKTRIVREWINHLFTSRERLSAVYVAPTRALVQEVSIAFTAELAGLASVHTLPWDQDIGSSARQMFVVTQERMHLLQQRPSFTPEFVFVDEAQNVGDKARGVLLSDVLDEAVRRVPEAQVIFASPLSSNPEVLLEGAPPDVSTISLLSETVTVNQNLLQVQQVPRKPSRFSVDLNRDGDTSRVGEFTIDAARVTAAQRLPFVAAALGGDSGNIVYANGPGTAERYANILFDILGSDADRSSPVLVQAAELIRGTVHPRFSLASIIRRGIGFHYGDIPLPVKTLVEDLFREGHLQYLICTSTLLEGVNLPCRNIFIRGPQKGFRNPMSLPDFWNLAGRAGRWGTEFQGNIVCIDVADRDQWPTPPGRRQRGPIIKSLESAVGHSNEIFDYLAADAPPADDRFSELIEASFSFLASRRASGRELDALNGIRLPDDDLDALQEGVDAALIGVGLPEQLLQRHPGISPLSMHRLYLGLTQTRDVENLLLLPPEDGDAPSNYKEALDWVSRHLGGPFDNDGRRFALSRLIVNWMKGVPLSQLIDYRLRWLREQRRKDNLATVIRQVMGDVEKVARFQAPKYLACFNDVVLYRLAELGVNPGDQPDITMMLELGVPRTTDMSLINVGLSRAAAMALSDYLTRPDMTPADVLVWLEDRDVEALGIPAFAAREVAALLATGARKSEL